MEAFIAFFVELTVYGSYFLTCPINNGPLVQYATKLMQGACKQFYFNFRCQFDFTIGPLKFIFDIIN